MFGHEIVRSELDFYVTLKKISGPEQRLKFDGNIRDVDIQFLWKAHADINPSTVKQHLWTFFIRI